MYGVNGVTEKQKKEEKPSEGSKIKEMPSIKDWIKTKKFKTTESIEVPERLLDQVIGQDKAVEIVRKSAEQKRHVMLIGDPGTGKSMVGQALAELLPKEKLVDILSLPNTTDENVPLIKTVALGQGKE